MAYIGNLRQYHLSDILRLIGDGLRRGRLVVERSGLRAELYCENGYLTHVWRNGTMPPLVQQWMDADLLTFTKLSQLAQQIGIDPLQLPDAQLAQFVIETSLLTPEQITNWAMNDVIGLLGILFSWNDGDYRFEDGMVPPNGRLRVPLSIALVLNTLVQRSASWQVAQPTIVVDLDDVLDFADIEPTYPHPIQVTREQWRILTLVDGESTVAEIAAHVANEAKVFPLDQQRYAVELQRFQEQTQRIASELVSSGLAVQTIH